MPIEKIYMYSGGGVAPQHIFDEMNTIDNTMTIGMSDSVMRSNSFSIRQVKWFKGGPEDWGGGGIVGPPPYSTSRSKTKCH